MSNEPLSHDELEQARHAIDFRTGKPAIQSNRYRHDLFAAQVARQAADEQAAAARPSVEPNAEALAELDRVQAWRNPLTGVREYERSQEMREAVESYRAAAINGEAIPSDVLEATRERMQAAADEAAAKKIADEQAELARYRKQRDGY